MASNLASLVRDLTPRPTPSQMARPPVADWDAPSATLRQIRRGLLTALARYRAQAYDGKIVFVRPETRWLRKTPRDPKSVWRRLVGEMAVVTVPGNHHTICSIHAGALTAELNRRIDEALAAE